MRGRNGENEQPHGVGIANNRIVCKCLNASNFLHSIQSCCLWCGICIIRPRRTEEKQNSLDCHIHRRAHNNPLKLMIICVFLLIFFFSHSFSCLFLSWVIHWWCDGVEVVVGLTLQLLCSSNIVLIVRSFSSRSKSVVCGMRYSWEVEVKPKSSKGKQAPTTTVLLWLCKYLL